MPKKRKNAAPAKQKASSSRKEIRGILFLLIAVVLGVSLYSYHPGDPLFLIKTSHVGADQNLFGTVGAHLAGGIFFVLGFASFWLFASFVILAFLSFRGDTVLSPLKTIVATHFLIFSFAGILNLYWPEVIVFRGGEVISGGQTMNPSTQQLLEAIEALPSDKLIILPNNSNVIMAARQAAEMSDKEVFVVPTRTIPQGIVTVSLELPGRCTYECRVDAGCHR